MSHGPDIELWDRDSPPSTGDVIKRLCVLQAKVSLALYPEGYFPAADCFCREGHYGPTHGEGYRNELISLRFIIQAVEREIEVVCNTT